MILWLVLAFVLGIIVGWWGGVIGMRKLMDDGYIRRTDKPFE